MMMFSKRPDWGKLVFCWRPDPSSASWGSADPPDLQSDRSRSVSHQVCHPEGYETAPDWTPHLEETLDWKHWGRWEWKSGLWVLTVVRLLSSDDGPQQDTITADQIIQKTLIITFTSHSHWLKTKKKTSVSVTALEDVVLFQPIRNTLSACQSLYLTFEWLSCLWWAGFRGGWRKQSCNLDSLKLH